MKTLEFIGSHAIPVLENLCERSRKEVLAYFQEVEPWSLFWFLKRPATLAWVFTHDGAGAVVALVERDDGDWTVSTLTTDNFHRIAKPLTKRITGHILPLIRDLGGQRLTCCSLAERSPMQKWMTRSLGARQENVLRQHGRNGEDFILFAWDLT